MFILNMRVMGEEDAFRGDSKLQETVADGMGIEEVVEMENLELMLGEKDIEERRKQWYTEVADAKEGKNRGKCNKEKLMEYCDLFDSTVSRSTGKQDDFVVKLIDFMLTPHATTSIMQSSKGKKCLSASKKITSSSCATPSKSSSKIPPHCTSSSQKKTPPATKSCASGSKVILVLKRSQGRKDVAVEEPALEASKWTGVGCIFGLGHNGKFLIQVTHASFCPRDFNPDDNKRKKTVKEKPKSEKQKLSDNDLRNAICEILKEVDFNTATFTDILKQLGKHPHSSKASIKLMIQEELTKLADEADEEEPKKTGKKASG
ncbi:titin-like isoform X1 [Tanacetum coccineum]